MDSEDRFATMDRRDFLRLGSAGLAGAALLGTAGGRVLAQTDSSLKEQFESAASKYGVPVQLLLAMGYYNTLWEMPPPSTSAYRKGDPEGRGDYGIMQLAQNPTKDTLGKAAKLTALSAAQLKNDRSANIEGGAAVLADLAGKPRPKSLDGWQEALTQYADTDLYASQVYGVLKGEASLTISTGERLKLSPQDVDVPQVYTAQSSVSTDYPRTVWRPAASGNYTNSNRETSYDINQIVIHVAQGPYSGTIGWFENSAAEVSAHYVVSRKGGVAQCVRDEAIAWHAGWWPTNKHSIGIEHAGYTNNPNSFSRRMYHASARLSAWCCKKHSIPVDRRHIIGHYQVPGCSGPGGGADCHTDPGPYWNWTKYMRLVRYYRDRL